MASGETGFSSVSFLAGAGSFFLLFSLEGSGLDSGFASFSFLSESESASLFLLETFLRTASFFSLLPGLLVQPFPFWQ